MSHPCQRISTVLAGTILTGTVALAQSGTWTAATAGPFNWGDPANWSAGVIADGAGNTANFTANITAEQAVNLEADRIIGNLVFTDSTTSSNNLTLSGVGSLNLDLLADMPAVNVTQSGRLLTLGLVLTGNDGVQKTGAGTLVFNNASDNTFTGGFRINGGVVRYDSATHANAWGDPSNVITFTGNATLHNNNNTYTIARSIDIQPGVTASMTGAFQEVTNVSGAVSGSGSLSVSGASNGYAVNLNSTSNSFSGTIHVAATAFNLDLTAQSLADGPGKLKLGTGSATVNFTLGSNLPAPVTWNTRQVELAGTNGAITIKNNASGSANTLTILPDLAFTATSSGNKTLTLGGSNPGVNTFAGAIGNNGTSTTALTKTDGGTWALRGSNTYSGNTNLSAAGTTGRLVFQGSASLSPSTKLVFAQTSSNVQSVRFLDDGVGTIGFTRPIDFGGSNTIQQLNLFVGNNNTANLGSSTGTTTGSTIQIGDITHISTAADTNTWNINATGANTYRLQTGMLTLNNLVARSPGQTTTTVLNPTSANMTIAGITMAAGNTGSANDGIPALVLGGTSSDNHVTGPISDALDAETGARLPLTKNSTSTWTLSGLNTYSGPTVIANGTLIISSMGDIGGGASSLGNPAAGNGIIRMGNDTNTGTLRYTGTGHSTNRPIQININNNSATGGAVIRNDGAGTLIFTAGTFNTAYTLTQSPTRKLTLGGMGDGEIHGTIQNNSATGKVALTKEDSGTWTLEGTNTYTGPTTVSGGTLVLAGATAATGLIHVSAQATLAGGGSGGIATMDNEAILSPGTEDGGADNFISLAGLSMSDDSVWRFEAGAPSATYYTSPDDSPLTDHVTVLGPLLLSGRLLIANRPDASSYNLAAATVGDRWLIMSYTDTFDNQILDIDPASASPGDGHYFAINTDSNPGHIYLEVLAVPEPGAASLLTLGLLAVLMGLQRQI